MLDLEKALHKRCEADPQYATLWAQWMFDRQLVGRALGSIPLIFPHYSLHDASHADTILRQMARVLGTRRIEQLGPTDLWLLLESAYHHDLGMVVPEATQQAWWTDKKFEEFLRRQKDHSDEDIRNAAMLLDKGNEVRPNSGMWPFDVRRALVLVMAEYARPRHAEQSRKYVDAPSLIELHSPRTMLVPRRFWSLLGRICESHGRGFKDTLKLPKRESGFGVDEAHPRFIACMLRLGDLLDLDDGRFCPVLARAFGGLPLSSKVHQDKHSSIEEFLVDASEIRVVAECSTPEAFDATEQWLSWLRDELRDQGVHWAEISPQPDFGAIPSAGRIEARLLDYHTFADGRRPRFDVDKGAMLEFVQGAGLYTDETACIAELLQNAVDATLLRIWADDRKKWTAIHESQDDQALEKLREELRKYPIDVQVKKHGREGDENHWEVIIEDQGAGIHKDDIPYLQCVGSSRKNPRRVERLRGMPEWMKPAGFFGIGLQSAFLFTDRVTIRSRADDSLETIEIEFKQRPGSKPSDERQILVRTLKAEDAFSKAGTRIEFVLREPRVRKRVRWSSDDRETRRVVMDYDPLLDDHLPIIASQVRDTTRRFAMYTLARIRLTEKLGGVEKAEPRDVLVGSESDTEIEAGAQEVTQPRFFDPATGIEIAVKAAPYGYCEFFYRGRRAKLSSAWQFFDLRVLWHQSDASKILTINREEVRPIALNDVELRIRCALLNVLPRYYEAIKDRPERAQELRYLALAAEVGEDIRHLRQDGKLPHLEQWKHVEYQRTSETLGQILEAQQIVIVEDPQWSTANDGNREPELVWSADRQLLTIRGNSAEDYLWALMRDRYAALRDSSSSGKFTLKKKEWIILRSRPDDIITTDEAFKSVLKSAANAHYGLARRTIPCRNRFLAMAMSKDAELELGYRYSVFARLHPRAISPFRVGADEKISLDGVEALVKWTYEHRLEQATTERDIARAVIDLVETADVMLRDEWGDRKDYSVDELRRNFVKLYGKEVLPAPVEESKTGT